MKLLLKESLCKKGGKVKEDGYLAKDNFYVVIDGATGLGPSSFFPSDASWLKTQFQKKFKACSDYDSQLEDLSHYFYEKFIKRVNFCEDSSLFPSLGLAWVELKESKLCFYQLGDVEIYVHKKNHQDISFRESNLPTLDEESLSLLLKIAKEKNITPLKARPFIQEKLRENRRLANQANGYGVFTLYPHHHLPIHRKEVLIEKGDEIYLASDGFMQLVTAFGVYPSRYDLFSSNKSLISLYRELKKAAINDPEFVRHPRFKFLDDATCLKLIVL